jgi:hypothetical protein
MTLVVLNTGLESLVRSFPQDHRALHMLAFMARRHPNAVSRRELMAAGAFAEHLQGRLCAYTAFYWWVERANDELRPRGWRIAEPGSFYRLIKIKH